MTEVYLDLPVYPEFINYPFSLTFNHLREKQCCHFLKGTSPKFIVCCNTQNVWSLFLGFTGHFNFLFHIHISGKQTVLDNPMASSDLTFHSLASAGLCCLLSTWIATEPSEPGQLRQRPLSGSQRPDTRLEQNDYLRALLLDIRQLIFREYFCEILMYLYLAFQVWNQVSLA